MGLRATNSPQSRPIMPGMKRFAVLLVAIVVPLSLAAQPRLQTYSHPTCRYSFKHVAGWRVQPSGDPEHLCEVHAQSPAGSEVVWADAGRGGFDAAPSAVGFVRVGDEVKRRGKRALLAAGAGGGFLGDAPVWKTF